MRIFGSDRIANVMDKLGIEEGEVITHSMVTKSVQRAQQKLETRNFSIRKHVLEYDMVMNTQREIIYTRRNLFLDERKVLDELDNIMTEFIDENINEFNNGSSINSIDYDNLSSEFLESLSVDINDLESKSNSTDKLKQNLKNSLNEVIAYKKDSIGSQIFENFVKFVSLSEIDKRWREHLSAMDQMREGINLRAYGQKNPLIEYKKEGFILFEEMMFSINKEILKNIFRTNLTKVDESKIVVESNIPKNLQMSHSKTSGINLPNLAQKKIQKPISNTATKKYGRNDKIKISNGSETKIIKFKKAENLLNQGWNIIE